MTTQVTTKRGSQTLLIGLIAVCCGASVAPALAQRPVPAKAKQQYQVSSLPTLGGTTALETASTIRVGQQAIPD